MVAFAAETASISGDTKRDINRHLSRAEALGDDLLKVAGTSLDKSVELDALKAILAAQLDAPEVSRWYVARWRFNARGFKQHNATGSVAGPSCASAKQVLASAVFR